VPIGRRRAEIPDRLAAAIHQALAPHPEDRFADARSLQEALLPFAEMHGRKVAESQSHKVAESEKQSADLR
jgi:hypothetical protein